MPRDPLLDPRAGEQIRDPWIWCTVAAIAALAARTFGAC